MPINTINWIKSKERDIDIAIQSIYMIGHGRQYFRNNSIDIEVANHLALSNGKLFFDLEELNKARETVLNWKSLAKNTKNITKKFMKIAESYNTFLEKNKGIDFEHISKDELKKIYKEYLNNNYNLIPYSFIMSMVVEEVMTKKLIARLACENAEKICLQLVSPNKISATTREYRSRIELARLAQTKEFQTAVDKHIKKFAWLSVYRPTDAPLSRDELVKSIQKMQDMPFTAEAVHSVELDRDTDQLVQILKENAWIRTYRRELMCKGFFVMRPMYKRIAKEMNVNFEDLNKIACWEIETFLDTGQYVSLEEIERRSNDFTLVRLGGNTIIISGQDAKIAIANKDVVTTDIKGQCAFEGKVLGTIQIIRTKEDLASFKEGNILVAHTVATWMTPAVVKCSGIITEKGGVLSHTSIVAREFKKPCIVGVGESITSLKDEMIIRLNATAGKVEEIK